MILLMNWEEIINETPELVKDYCNTEALQCVDLADLTSAQEDWKGPLSRHDAMISAIEAEIGPEAAESFVMKFKEMNRLLGDTQGMEREMDPATTKTHEILVAWGLDEKTPTLLAAEVEQVQQPDGTMKMEKEK